MGGSNVASAGWCGVGLKAISTSGERGAEVSEKMEPPLRVSRMSPASKIPMEWKASLPNPLLSDLARGVLS